MESGTSPFGAMAVRVRGKFRGPPVLLGAAGRCEPRSPAREVPPCPTQPKSREITGGWRLTGPGCGDYSSRRLPSVSFRLTRENDGCFRGEPRDEESDRLRQ